MANFGGRRIIDGKIAWLVSYLKEHSLPSSMSIAGFVTTGKLMHENVIKTV
ncbi:unnamed protein product [Dovyalis caffra]|uniref:Uncharacterized protein n=1 Tax=Dovyalis caffra TaxID=77055 RepID=A0AAV1RHC9_9ROSI|nr:unnamed protein product [Dovyalis caffra]